MIVFDEIQDVLAVQRRDGTIRSVIQHQADAATYAFAGSAPGMMAQFFADPRRPLLTRPFPETLAPLPLQEVADYVTTRFARSEREVGSALTPMLEFTRGHPQRSMMLAHYLWQRTPRGSTADEETWVAVLDQAATDSAPLMRAIWREPQRERAAGRTRHRGDHDTAVQPGHRDCGGDQAHEHPECGGESDRSC